MKTMKAYIQPETIEVRLLPSKMMQVANPSDMFAAPGGESSGSMMFDAPLGNKRRQL